MSGRAARTLIQGMLTGALALALAVPFAHAKGPGGAITGVITEIDLSGSPRVMKVKTDDGEVTERVANRTRVIFEKQWAPYYPTPELSNLQAGMGVRFHEGGDVLSEVQVTFVPADKLPAKPKPAAPAGNLAPGLGTAAGTTGVLTGRVVSIDRDRSLVNIDVNGKVDPYVIENPAIFKLLHDNATIRFETRPKNGRQVLTGILH